jgi:hypothetical protein
MKGIIVGVVAVLAMFGFTSVALSDINMQEGLWEMTVTTRMEGMPYPMPPMKYTDCLTRKDMNPQKQEKGQECRQTASKISGNTYSWTMECASAEGTTRSSGAITYRGTNFSGTITTTTQGMTLKQDIAGRRIGACK